MLTTPPGGREITVLIAEDDGLLRHFLVTALAEQEGVRVVGTARTGREAVDAVAAFKPDVLLLDLGLPELPGLAVLDQLSVLPDPPAVLVLSGEETAETQMDTARHGAKGFLYKSEAGATLPGAIQAVAAGGIWFPPQVMACILNDYPTLARRKHDQERPINQLTDREREVLVKMAQGQTNQQIASDLYLSVPTVKLHVRNIFRKLHLTNRAGAAAFAVREGLMGPADKPEPERTTVGNRG